MGKKVWGKTELVDKVAEKAGITKKDAKQPLRQLWRSSKTA